MPAATMSWVAPAALGAIGLMQQGKANSAQNSAQAQQQQLIDRQIRAFDALFGAIEGADKSGAFDAQSRVDQALKDQSAFEERDLKGAAGAYSIAGYNPGDTPMQDALKGVQVNYRREWDRMVQDIRRGALFDKIGAYQSLNSGSGALNTGIGAAGQNLDYARSQGGGFAGLLGSIMPYLQSQKAGGAGGGAGGSGSNASTGGNQTQVTATNRPTSLRPFQTQIQSNYSSPTRLNISPFKKFAFQAG